MNTLLQMTSTQLTNLRLYVVYKLWKGYFIESCEVSNEHSEQIRDSCIKAHLPNNI